MLTEMGALAAALCSRMESLIAAMLGSKKAATCELLEIRNAAYGGDD
jgi:hypothetical protein